MSRLLIEGLSKRFAAKPPTVAADDLNLEIHEGEFLVLLGPSGCGKTTALRCVAGLETPDTGRIVFGDTTVFDAARAINKSPDQRSIGMVFQSYALWPHMTVRKNIAYPLRARKIRTAESKSWVDETAQMVDCQNLLDRYPSQLSGGQQQRVALARGLVSRPDVVLFDEPLSNLDARLRDLVRAQLHELHARLHFTAVFVTHDQSEALALGDRLAIMRAGRFEQIATPEEVFERPATEYVAGFIGMSNRFELARADDAGTWTCFGQEVEGSPRVGRELDEVVIRMRDDDVALAPSFDALPPEALKVWGTFVDSQFGGRHMDIVADVAGNRLLTRVSVDAFGGWARRLEPGEKVAVGLGHAGSVYFTTSDQRIDATPVAA